jgi:hypothetical protein
MHVNGLNSGGPFFYPDDGQGSTGFSSGPSEAQQQKFFTQKMSLLAVSFLNRAFENTATQANIKQLDNGSLEISPKKSLWTFAKKVIIPNEIVEARVQELNSYCRKKSLGHFSCTQKDGIYSIAFNPSADSRAMGTFLSSPRDPLRQVLAESSLGLVREASKKDAFIFHQALKLLDGTQQKYIFSCADPQNQSISVKFDSNVFADQFLKRFCALQESNLDLFLDLGLTAKRSSTSTDFFKISFKLNWNSELYQDSATWCTEANLSALESVFNVCVKDTLKND